MLIDQSSTMCLSLTVNVQDILSNFISMSKNHFYIAFDMNFFPSSSVSEERPFCIKDKLFSN